MGKAKPDWACTLAAMTAIRPTMLRLAICALFFPAMTLLGALLPEAETGTEGVVLVRTYPLPLIDTLSGRQFVEPVASGYLDLTSCEQDARDILAYSQASYACSDQVSHPDRSIATMPFGYGRL